jgi:hypothetical protein
MVFMPRSLARGATVRQMADGRGSSFSGQSLHRVVALVLPLG